jgi:hypothetical protein
VGAPLVLKKAEQVDAPLIGIGQAIEQDHEKRERMHLPQKRAAGLLGEISKNAQKIEEPIREIAHELEDRTFVLRPL